MADSKPKGMDEAEQAGHEVATITDPKLLEQFAEMAVMIPAEPGGGTENILRQVLAAQTWDQIDDPWKTADIEDILRKTLKLDHATRRPSTVDGGLGIFIIMHMTDPKTGKKVVKATGSIAVIGQVCALYALNAMPALVEWCRADRPTDRGYYPQHLKIIDSMGASKP